MDLDIERQFLYHSFWGMPIWGCHSELALTGAGEGKMFLSTEKLNGDVNRGNEP